MTTLNCPAPAELVCRDLTSNGSRFNAARRPSRDGARRAAQAVQGRLQAWVERKFGSQGRYILRLVGYTLAQRKLLAIVIGTGFVGFLLPFIYPWLVGSAIDHVIAPHAAADGSIPTTAERMHWLWVLVGVGMFTAIGQGLVVYGRGMSTIHLGHRIVTQLRQDLFDHVQRLSLHFYSRNRTGSIANRLLHDVHTATSIIYGGIIVVGLDVAQLLIALALLLLLNWKLALVCLIVMPAYAATFKVFNPLVRRASETLHDHYCKISGNLQEQLAGAALIKTYAAEKREQRRFNEDVEEHHEKVVYQAHTSHLVSMASEMLVCGGNILVVGYGSWLAIKGELSAGDLTRFLGYVAIMYGPVRRFADLNMVYQNSMTAISRVFRVFDIAPKIADKPTSLALSPQQGEVVFKNVHFRYTDDSDETRMPLDGDATMAARSDEAAAWVLKGIDLHVRPGERVALVGPSGSGKSTLVSLLPRLYDIGEGNLSVDGLDIRDYTLASLRQSIAIVQQESFVFSGTIRENLRYGRPDASEAQIIAAAKAANAHEFIMALPRGYDSLLGERGANLSGGQRQRLSIARALLKDPRILILDEATSALDTQSERLVQEALDTLMHNRTCFIIAHRLSTVRNADRIVVLKDGQIEEMGAHDELVEQGGLYARLVQQQFNEPAEPAEADVAEAVLVG